HVDKGEINQQIDCDNREHAAKHRSRNVATGIVDLFRKIDHAAPAVIRIDHRLQREGQTNDESKTQRRALSRRSCQRTLTAKNETGILPESVTGEAVLSARTRNHRAEL